MEDRVEYTAEQPLIVNKIAAMVAQTFSRMSLARSLQPQAFGGARKYNTVLGYPDIVEIEQYWGMYQRGSIAATIVDLPAEDTWKKPPTISENDNIDTEFARAWLELVDRFRIWSVITRADRLSGIGQFGVILVGVKDGRALELPVDRELLTGMGQKGILYYRPLSELRAEINTLNVRIDNRRYGLPEAYKLRLQEDKLGGEQAQTQTEHLVHWTRVIHLADNRLDSQVFGVPRLRKVFNPVSDLLYKILGGTAEAIWLEIRKGTLLRAKEGYDIDTANDAEMARIQNEIEKYVHDMARVLLLTGMEAQDVGSSTVPDSTGAFENAIGIIAAATKIPQRKLLGASAGELASSQEDTRQWFGVIADRQRQYAEPDVLRPFIDWHVALGLLPPPAGGPKAYDIGQLGEDEQRHWPSLFELTDLERAEIGQITASGANSMRSIDGTLPLELSEQRVVLGHPAQPIDEDEEEEEIEDNSDMAANSGFFDYGKGIRDSIRGVWTGRASLFDASFNFFVTLNRGLRRAWLEGAAKVGVKEEDLTEAEIARIDEIVSKESEFAFAFLDEVAQETRADKVKLGKHIKRSLKWMNRYTEVVNLGMLSARDDPKLKWVINREKDNCVSALKLSDKVKRKSTWDAAGVRPQSPDKLECMVNAGGIPVCGCKFEETDEPLSRGPLPGLP